MELLIARPRDVDRLRSFLVFAYSPPMPQVGPDPLRRLENAWPTEVRRPPCRRLP
jgi:hypothetical protein